MSANHAASTPIDLEPLVAPLAAAICAASGARARSSTLLTASGPRRGRLYDGELAVIGRAVNGWDDIGWSRTDASDPVWCASRARELLAVSNSTAAECSLAWVTGMAGRDRGADGNRVWNSNRSRFWRVATDVRRALPPLPAEPVPSTLVWTNLYPVAPAAGRNPGSALCRAQQREAESFLGAQLELFRPRRALWLTGIDWAEPFLGALGISTEEIEGSEKAWVGKASLSQVRCSVVVVRHPERKVTAEIVAAALRGFERLD